MGMDARDIGEELNRQRAVLTGYFRGVLHDTASAEDVFQDVCLRALKCGEFETSDHLRRWAMRVGRNRSIDLLRRLQRRECLLEPDVLEQLEHDAGRLMVAAGTESSDGRVAALLRCLEQLAPKSREVVGLRYFDGMAGHAVAARLGRKVDAVYKMLARAYVTLRQCVEQRLEREEGVS